ncbi:MAG: molybdopterin synthase catalytic subunit MoaE [Pseudomonadota bacterium]
MVRIQTEDFDLGQEVTRLRAGKPGVGAVAVFLGTVRDINEGHAISTLELEHYPGMTERALEDIETKARARWALNDVLIIHRVGPLAPEDQIVLVAVTSRHRHAAFESCEYIMDYLKTRAPFWKKEDTPEGPRWVDARESDFDAAARWGQD